MADSSISQLIRALSSMMNTDSGTERALNKFSLTVVSESVNSVLSCTNDRGPVAVDIDGTTTGLKDCQREHWGAAHKAQCRLSIDRKQLYRIGALLQWAFYAASKAVWCDEITRVQKIEQDGQDNEVKLLVWRAKKQDPSRFSAFPHEVLDDERDERAVLARMAAGTPGAAMISGLLLELLKASKTKIQVHEVEIRPGACRFVRFVPQAPAGSDDPSICWLFRATLRDGSTFAIDICNAQYTITTAQKHECGVFPWAKHLQRLSMPKATLLDFQTLGSCAKRQLFTPMIGNIKDVEAGIVTEEDMQLTANIMATTYQKTTAATLPIKRDGLTLAKLMRLPSADYEHALAVYKTRYEEILDGGRTFINAGRFYDHLLCRLEVGAWQGS